MHMNTSLESICTLEGRFIECVGSWRHDAQGFFTSPDEKLVGIVTISISEFARCFPEIHPDCHQSFHCYLLSQRIVKDVHNVALLAALTRGKAVLGKSGDHQVILVELHAH